MARVRIVANVKGVGRIESPRFSSRGDAEKQVEELRKAMSRGGPNVTSLDWLAVDERNLVSVHIEEVDRG